MTHADFRRIVVISDFCTSVPPQPGVCAADDTSPVRINGDVIVRGGYLERLPLSVVQAGIADCAEIWSFVGDHATPTGLSDTENGKIGRAAGRERV